MGGEVAADRMLLQRFCNGCYDSFEELVSRYERQVFGVALALLQDSKQAERVLAEVFVSLAKRAEELLDNPSLDHFLFRTMRDLLIEDEQKAAPLEIISSKTNHTKNAQTSVPNRQFSQIPIQFSFVFVLRHVARKSLKDISQIEQIPQRAAQLRLLRCYRSLQRLRDGTSTQSVWRAGSSSDEPSWVDI